LKRSVLEILDALFYIAKGLFLPKYKLYYSKYLGIRLGLKPDSLVDFLIYNNGVFQPEVIDSITHIIKKYQVTHFVDIGSHIGQMSIFVAKNFPELKVLSFEPNPATFGRQLENIRLNDVVLEAKNVGFDNKHGVCQFRRAQRRHFFEYFKLNDGICFPVSQAESGDFESICITLDELTEQINKDNLVLIKIDVEGAEKKILEGGTILLSWPKAVFLIELLFDCYPQKCSDCVELLSSYGFKMYDTQLNEVTRSERKPEDGDYIFMKG